MSDYKKTIESLKKELEFYQRFERSIVSLLSYNTEGAKSKELIDQLIQSAIDMLDGGAGLFIERTDKSNTYRTKTTNNLPQGLTLTLAGYLKPDKPLVLSKPELLFEYLPKNFDFSHAFILPLNFRHEDFGIIIILARQLGQLDANKYTRALSAIVNATTISISNLHLLQNITDSAQEAVALNNISLNLNTFQNLHDLLTSFMKKTNKFIGTKAAAVHLWDEETNKLKLESSSGFSVSPNILRDVSSEESVIGWVAKNHQVLEIPNLKESPYYEELSGLQDFIYLLIIPIISRNKLIGTISYLSSYFNAISDKKITSLLSIINSLAINIENVLLYEKTIKLARYDGLTGLLNHREFERILDKELERAKRYGHNLTLVMIDIDYFKNYNDNNGHTQGDSVLETIGETITDSIRRLDIGFRYGGEEFSILLLETEESEAYDIAERVRRRWAKIDFAGEGKQPNANLTISLGIASFPADAENKLDLVNKADEALYHAKDLGRNQTQLYRKKAA